MLDANPYEAPTLSESKGFDTDPVSHRQLVLRPTFAVCWICAWLTLGLGMFYLHHTIDPIPTVDFQFYIRLHASIGAVAGLLSWYTARLAALGRITAPTLSLLLLPCGFVMLLALELNPIVAAFTLAIIASTLSLALLVSKR